MGGGAGRRKTKRQKRIKASSFTLPLSWSVSSGWRRPAELLELQLSRGHYAQQQTLHRWVDALTWSAKWMKKFFLTGPPCYLHLVSLPTRKWLNHEFTHTRAHRLFAAFCYFTWWILSLMGPLACRKYSAMCRSHLKWFAVINRGEITSELPLAWYQPEQVQTGAFSLPFTFDFFPLTSSQVWMSPLCGRI